MVRAGLGLGRTTLLNGIANGSLVPRPSSNSVEGGLVPRPSPHVQERGSGVLNDFSCQMGRVAPRSESSNQIAERVIIGDDVGNRARDPALQTDGKRDPDGKPASLSLAAHLLCSWL